VKVHIDCDISVCREQRTQINVTKRSHHLRSKIKENTNENMTRALAPPTEETSIDAWVLLVRHRKRGGDA
jgi:hypothetical protein